MPSKVRVRFEEPSVAFVWGARLKALDPTDASTSAYPYLEEDEVAARIRLTNSRMERLFVVPQESHVRVYHGTRLIGIYCGHSATIEPVGSEAMSTMQVRYRDGYAEVYCPHSQEWEPLG
jgi:hypothetical protein